MICVIFSILSVVVIVNGGQTLLGIAMLLFFGGGGIVYYILSRKGRRRIERSGETTITESRKKLIVLLLGSSIFVVCSYLFLPFHHLFDEIPRYSPLLGYVVGVVGMLFFGFGVVTAIIRLVRPVTVMQISKKGLWVATGRGKGEWLRWDAIAATSRDEHALFIHVSGPAPREERVVDISLRLIEYDADEVENLIERKRKEFTPNYNRVESVHLR